MQMEIGTAVSRRGPRAHDAPMPDLATLTAADFEPLLHARTLRALVSVTAISSTSGSRSRSSRASRSTIDAVLAGYAESESLV